MRVIREVIVGLVMAAVAASPALGSVSPTQKCVQAKLKAAGKKLSGKLNCHAKAKAKSVAVDASCLAKAETKFDSAMAKAGNACDGTATAVESAVDDCVTALLPLVPGDGKCPSTSAKATGKRGSGLLGCQAKDVGKPGSFAACDAKGQTKLASSLTKAGGCADATSIDNAAHQCLTDIHDVIEPPPTTTSTSSSTSTTESTSTSTSTSTTTSTSSTTTTSAPNPNDLPINHVVVLMQENRSADHYLGKLNAYGGTDYETEPNTGNPDPTSPGGAFILPFHQTQYCEVADLNHSWNGTHAEVNGGAMDGFTAANARPSDPTGSRAMGYYDETDLPFYYGLYDTFATGDRYFSSALTQTFPNRLYLLAGTSFGHIRNDVFFSNFPSVFNLLDNAGVSWRIYAAQYPLAYGPLFFQYVRDQLATHVFPMSQYYDDLANDALPSVAFVDPTLTEDPQTANDEHPPSNVQVGQAFVADVVNALMASPGWQTSAFFLTYDEHGGYYDHVVPPPAPIPDGIPPILQPGDTPGAFDQYGVRVPVAVVSPYSKPHFVSHVVHDHTSILRFIEYRFGMPALTNRDLNADPMLEFFDFNTATFATPPSLPAAVIDPVKLAMCPNM